MKNFCFLVLLTVILITPFVLSCQRIEPVERKEGELKTAQLTDLKGVPLEYGELIAVTSPSTHPNWAHLWFEDKNKTIRMVRTDFSGNRLHEKVTIFPRN